MQDDGSEGSSSYYGPGVICCSVNTFACTNFTWGFFSLLFFVLGLVGLVSDEGFLLLFIEEIYITLTSFGGFSFFIVILGMLGACAKVEIFFICYIFFMGLVFFAQTLAIVFFSLYLAEVGTVGEVDEAANGAQRQFEDQLIDFARAEPEKWIDTQNQFNCCGINAVDVEFQTGDDCEPVETVPNCLDKFTDLVREVAPFVGTAAGILLLFQLGAIIAAIRMYWVPVWRGGWMFDEEELEQMAEEKDLKFQKKPEVQGGGGALTVLRNAGNRLSFRVQNAITPSPNVPQGAGFLKRLSYNAQSPGFGVPGGNNRGAGFGMPNPNNRAGGFGMPGPKPQGGFNLNSAATSGSFGGPPKRNRLSNRLSAGFQAFGNAFGQMKNNFRPAPPAPPKQPVAPPGYAGVPPPGIGGGNNYGQKTYTPQRPQQSPAPRGTNNSYSPPSRGTNNSFGPPRETQMSNFSQPPPPPMHGHSSPPNNWNSSPAMPKISSNRWDNSNRGTGFGTSASSKAPKKPSNQGGLNKFYKKKKNKGGNKPSFGGGRKPPKAKSPLAAQNGGLLAQIQQGKGLKPTVTNDRSAPMI